MGLIVSSSGRGFDAAKQSGHGYSSITVQGSAKAQLGNSTHNGDVVHVTCEHFHGTFSGNPTVDSPEASTFGSERPLVKRKRHMHDGEDQSQRQHHTLGAVLTKLGEFSCSIKHQKLSKDARSVARHLCILLDNMRGGELVSDHVQEDWERLKNSITVTERIVINALPARIARANVVRVDRKRDVIRFGQWKISLTTAVFHSRDAIGRESTETESAIRIEPSTHLVGPVIAVFVGERTDFFGKSFVHPIVFAYRSVHNGSQIFALIKEDDIDGLMNLLATQGATTRDCDEQNRSLLYYACYHRSPRCCRFLIEQGADLDRYSQRLELNGDTDTSMSFSTALTAVETFGFEFPGSHRESRAKACVQLLLDAGADPTIGDPGTLIGPISPLSSWLDLRSSPFVDAFSILQDKGRIFIDKESTQEYGASLWLQVCRGTRYLHDPVKAMDNLLSMGFDIAEVCESNQWNCLFYCVLMADTMKVSNELAALRFLLSRFSDVYAVDAFGKTIFDYVDDIDGHGACCYGRDQANFPRPRHGYGTYRRDLLYCALERSELLCGRPDGGTFKSREYRFAKNYTPLNLHALRYLDEWTHGDLWPQVKSELGKHPWSEHEKEEAVRLFQDIERHDWCDWVPEEHIIDLARYLGVSPNQRIAFKHRRRKPRGGLFR